MFDCEETTMMIIIIIITKQKNTKDSFNISNERLKFCIPNKIVQQPRRNDDAMIVSEFFSGCGGGGFWVGQREERLCTCTPYTHARTY